MDAQQERSFSDRDFDAASLSVKRGQQHLGMVKAGHSQAALLLLAGAV